MSTNNTTAKAETVTHKHKYIFPNFMAKMMANVDPKTQYESAMLSSFLILIGLVMTSIVMIFFMDLSVLYKVLIGLNCLGGFLYISSSLVTVYQQYANYMDVMEIQKSMLAEAEEQPKISSSNPTLNQKPKKKKYNRGNQFLFSLGILFVIAAGALMVSQVSDYITTLVPELVGYILYVAGACLVIGMFLIFWIIKKGKDKMKRIALIEKLIKEGKIAPKGAGINRTAQPQIAGTKPGSAPVARAPIQDAQKQTLNNRLKGLVSSIKVAKANNQSEEERKIQEKLQVTLNEIRRLKISERRTNNSVVDKGY